MLYKNNNNNTKFKRFINFINFVNYLFYYFKEWIDVKKVIILILRKFIDTIKVIYNKVF